MPPVTSEECDAVLKEMGQLVSGQVLISGVVVNEQLAVELQIWSEHSKGISVGPGTVVVALPCRRQVVEKTS